MEETKSLFSPLVQAEMEVKTIGPIEQYERDRLDVLQSLFPTEMKLSSDLQQLILDFVFYRKVKEEEIDGVKTYARLSVILLDGKYCYDVRHYNDKLSFTISRFALSKATLAMGLFNLFFKNELQAVINENCYYWVRKRNDFIIYSRYAFCPIDGETYQVGVCQKRFKKSNMCLYIAQTPKIDDKQIFKISELNKLFIGQYPESHEVTLKLLQHIKLVEKYGNDWSKYQVDNVPDDVWEEYLKVTLGWPKDNEL